MVSRSIFAVRFGGQGSGRKERRERESVYLDRYGEKPWQEGDRKLSASFQPGSRSYHAGQLDG